MKRSAKTRIITNARSSLQGGSVLVWLMGDSRILRDDARIYFRREDLSGDTELETVDAWQDDEWRSSDSPSEVDPEEADYARVLELINQFLPVKELAGRPIGLPVLRQFGLVENERVDEFLATAFGPEADPSTTPVSTSEERRVRRGSKASKSPPVNP